MTINPNAMQMIQAMRQNKNPQQMVMSMLENQIQQNNPVAGGLLQMAKTGDSSGIERVARNIMKEKGLDFDTEFNNFKSLLSLGK